MDFNNNKFFIRPLVLELFSKSYQTISRLYWIKKKTEMRMFGESYIYILLYKGRAEILRIPKRN